MTKPARCCNTKMWAERGTDLPCRTHYSSWVLEAALSLMQEIILKLYRGKILDRSILRYWITANTHVQQSAAQGSPDRSWIPPRTGFWAARWLRTHLENRTCLGWQKQCSQGPVGMPPQACSELYSVSEKTALKQGQQNQITAISIPSLTDFAFSFFTKRGAIHIKTGEHLFQIGSASWVSEEAKLHVNSSSKSHPLRSIIILNDLTATVQKMMRKNHLARQTAK